MTMRDIGRYLRTLRHVPPRQVAARIRLRSIRRLLRRRPDIFERRWTPDPGGSTPGWPVGFRPLDGDRYHAADRAAEIERSVFVLLNDRAELHGDWECVDRPQLWRFHLHYWDWCWHLVNHRDTADLTRVVERLHADWARSTTYGRLDAWSPYVVSLRLWTWCGVHSHLDAALADTVAAEIRRHTGFLAANLETDVGGNHLVKNLKALVGGAVFLGDDGLLASTLERVASQLRTQVLDDGGHYELSPSYHAQVLGDVLDMQFLLDAAGDPRASMFHEPIRRMRQWLAALVGPDGHVPVFNDSFAVDPAELDRLGIPEPPTDRLLVLAATGYVVARPSPNVQVVIDVGRPCPPELPAHAQADCLSFELVVGTERVVVDAGTSEYGAGARRAFERSTAAHNTVELDGISQTEVWGAFRAGRRARPVVHFTGDTADGIVVDAQHDGYRHLDGAVHRRRFTIDAAAMTISDAVDGGGDHHVVSRLRFPGAVERLASDAVAWRGGSGDPTVSVRGDRDVTIDPDQAHAREFGRCRTATVVSMDVSGPLPTTLEWRFRW